MCGKCSISKLIKKEKLDPREIILCIDVQGEELFEDLYGQEMFVPYSPLEGEV